MAKDRFWFGDDYTPFDSQVHEAFSTLADGSGPGLAVLGIGTVDLPVKRDPEGSGPEAHGFLRLRNVLHCPGSLCNIIGQPIFEDYPYIKWGFKRHSKGTIHDKQDRVVAFFRPDSRLFQVCLSNPPIGPQVGPTPFEKSSAYVIGVRWSDGEQVRWEASRAAEEQQPASAKSFSSEEKQ